MRFMRPSITSHRVCPTQRALRISLQMAEALTLNISPLLFDVKDQEDLRGVLHE